jgi:hypothetical protein
MMKYNGIIDSVRNPFQCPSWIKQEYQLTAHRRLQVEKLFGKSKEEIIQSSRNEARYPAFIAIRWGYAVLQDGILVKYSAI